MGNLLKNTSSKYLEAHVEQRMQKLESTARHNIPTEGKNLFRKFLYHRISAEVPAYLWRIKENFNKQETQAAINKITDETEKKFLDKNLTFAVNEYICQIEGQCFRGRIVKVVEDGKADVFERTFTKIEEGKA